MTARVYLDQFAWVGLAQAHHGKSDEWRDVLDAVREARRDGEAVFPISLSHVNETVKRAADESRGRLLDVMAEHWDAHAIRPWSQMRRAEIRNAVKQRTGLPQEDLDAWAFGRGIGHVLGGEYHFTPKHPDADPRRLGPLIAALFAPERLLDYKDPDLAKDLRDGDPADANFLVDLQRSIDSEKAAAPRDKRRDAAKARFLMTLIVDPMIEILANLKLDPRRFMDDHLASREQMEQMIRDMPTLNTFHELTYARNASRPLKVNDVWDLALSNAVPYCDIVVTERQWCEFARQAGLDDLYGTKMFTAPADLATALRAL